MKSGGKQLGVILVNIDREGVKGTIFTNNMDYHHRQQQEKLIPKVILRISPIIADFEIFLIERDVSFL
ncbi:hypothetical protein P5673_003079 [Acropora cervicornis]|uniref:Uncharacterized protein n=1 Tax=Acropora cervicornis TaxID=6130 RepID=A0AAD9R220_ACRCE|nr:hypothetical protein P5673_003079 [Acropora cervicornis]